MRLADKVATMARRGAPLPYLRRVAYLESHGTEYIDTGVVKYSGLIVEMIISPVNDSPTSNSYLFGQRSMLVFDVRDTGGTLYFENSTARYKDFNWDSARKYKLKIERNNLYIDGNLELSSGSATSSSTDNLYLFAVNRSTILYGRWKIYEVKFYKEDSLVFCPVPVLDLSGRPAMYDDVSGQFFYNQGTGEFTWGELDASSALSSTRGGGTKCLTPRRSYRRSSRPSARFYARTSAWEVAA